MLQLFLCLILAFPLQAESLDPLEQGKRQLEQGNFAEAFASFLMCQQERPGDSSGFYYAGVTLVKWERSPEAVAQFRKAVSLDASLDNRTALARVLQSLGQPAAALDALGAVPEQDPDALWLKSDLSYERELFSEAMDALTLYRQLRPDDPRAVLRAAQIHLIEGRPADAEVEFRAAVERLSESPVSWHGLGLACWQTGKPVEAQRAFQKAVALDSENPAYRLDFGRFLQTREDWDKAIRELEESRRLDDGVAAVHFELSKSYRRANRSSESEQSLERFRQLQAQEQETRRAQREIGRLLSEARAALQSGRIRQAHDQYKEVLGHDPGNLEAHSTLAKIYLSSNLLERAASHLVELERSDSRNPQTYFLVADYWFKKGDAAKAEKGTREAILLRPDYADAHNLLGHILTSLGRHSDAVASFAEAVRLDPGRPQFVSDYEQAVRRPPQ